MALARRGPQTGGEDPAPAPACTMVIFGASEDLAKRPLIPSLYNLARAAGPSQADALSARDGRPCPMAGR